MSSIQVKQLASTTMVQPQVPTQQQGSSLNLYNNELVECLRDLREKRSDIYRAIQSEEKRKLDIEDKLQKLTEQLKRVNESLTTKNQAKQEYDSTIAETEAAYSKILESSQTLLTVLKREQSQLVGKTPAIKQLADVTDVQVNDINSVINAQNNSVVQQANNIIQQQQAKKNDINKTQKSSFFSFGRNSHSTDNLINNNNNKQQQNNIVRK